MRLMEYFTWLTGQQLNRMVRSTQQLIFTVVGIVFPGYVGVSALFGDSYTWEVVTVSGLTLALALAYAGQRSVALRLRRRYMAVWTPERHAAYVIRPEGHETKTRRLVRPGGVYRSDEDVKLEEIEPVPEPAEEPSERWARRYHGTE